MGNPGHMTLICKEGQHMKNVHAEKIQDGGTPGTSAHKDHASTLWSSEASWYLVRVEGDKLKGDELLSTAALPWLPSSTQRYSDTICNGPGQH